jgi:phenylalanyl-tRNA synthetase alpha chain
LAALAASVAITHGEGRKSFPIRVYGTRKPHERHRIVVRCAALADIAAPPRPTHWKPARGLLGKSGSITAQLKALGKLARRPAQGARARRSTACAMRSRSAVRAQDRAGRGRAGRALAGETHRRHPARARCRRGGLHPVTRTLERITEIFGASATRSADGPEIEDDWHNFEALNFPPHHPARAMHDTFYFGDGRLLRTHTSPVQIRYMQDAQPPIRIIAAGKVYRSDSDQTHTPMFHQVEGLLVDEHASFADLKGTLPNSCAPSSSAISRCVPPELFPVHRAVRRSRHRLGAAGWQRRAGWKCWAAAWSIRTCCATVGIDPERYTGFAFGLGVERFAMLRYGVTICALLRQRRALPAQFA